MLKVIPKYFRKYYLLLIVMVMTYFINSTMKKDRPCFHQTIVLPSINSNKMEERIRFVSICGNASLPKFAYGFLAVTETHLIAALVNIERLKEKRLPNTEEKTHVDFVILTNIILPQRKIKLFEDVKLLTYPKLPTPGGYYDESMVKLLFYNMTEYYRIIYIDTDALVLKSLDELFDLPSSISLASPVAYWENELCFTSALLVIKPNHNTWLELSSKMDETVKNKKADMDLINIFYHRRITVSFKIYPEVLLLPGYFVVLSSHFRDQGQSYYKEIEPIYINIDKLVGKIYIVHFSGQPKPWSLSKEEVLSSKSISNYFFSFNLEFIDAFKEIQNTLNATQTND